ncbi:ribosome-binding factor A-like [Montipora foliosa]|uniref:ribosome-binding factor A-like n=1 Tax=Montipora foliosa TaxID=591990 RepID=UPI0035F13132
MSCKIASSIKLVHYPVNNFLAKAVGRLKIQNHTQRIFFAQITRDYGDKFSIVRKKKNSRKNTSSSKASLRQSQVFQLDLLQEDDSPDKRVTARQRVISGAILDGVTNILNGPELDSNLKKCQIEITQVQTTPNFQLATVCWTVSDKWKGERVRIQNILEENNDYIRRLLPAYCSLNRFPQLVFIKDNSVEYQGELEDLFNQAKHADSFWINASKFKDS